MIVTRVVRTLSTYDATAVGYPASAPPVEQVLSRDTCPDFDALIARVLGGTLYNEAVPLGAYIALCLVKNDAEAQRIDALGPTDPGPPPGTGTSLTFELFNEERLVYSFRDDRNAGPYSGRWVQRLEQLTADPASRLYADHTPEARVHGYVEQREAGASYLGSVMHRLRREPRDRLFALWAGEECGDLEDVAPAVYELATMPGATPALDAAADAFAAAWIALNRADRGFQRYCAASGPADDDERAQALLEATHAALAASMRALGAFDIALDGGLRELLARS